MELELQVCQLDYKPITTYKSWHSSNKPSERDQSFKTNTRETTHRKLDNQKTLPAAGATFSAGIFFDGGDGFFSSGGDTSEYKTPEVTNKTGKENDSTEQMGKSTKDVKNEEMGKR